MVAHSVSLLDLPTMHALIFTNTYLLGTLTSLLLQIFTLLNLPIALHALHPKDACKACIGKVTLLSLLCIALHRTCILCFLCFAQNLHPLHLSDAWMHVTFGRMESHLRFYESKGWKACLFKCHLTKQGCVTTKKQVVRTWF